MSNKQIIELKNATVEKEDTIILKKASLCFNVGEHVAIIGPNGAGKSTLIKLITGEHRPIYIKDAPSVKIFGETRWDLFELRKAFGIVTGDLQASYRKDITGEEVVLSGYFGSIGTYEYQNITKDMMKHAQKMMRELGIKPLAKKYISRMSPGEARKVLIARALVHDPKMLILDEPTTNLDLKAIHEFLNTVRNVARTGRSILMVTHHINEIIPEIKRVVMLKDGKIFFDGSKEKALTSKNISLLFDAKLKVHKAGGYYTITYQ